MYRANAHGKDIFPVLLSPGFFANHLFSFEKQHICTLVNDFTHTIFFLVTFKINTEVSWCAKLGAKLRYVFTKSDKSW